MCDYRCGLPHGEVILYIALKAVAVDTFYVNIKRQCTSVSSFQITAECFLTSSCIKYVSFCWYWS